MARENTIAVDMGRKNVNRQAEQAVRNKLKRSAHSATPHQSTNEQHMTYTCTEGTKGQGKAMVIGIMYIMTITQSHAHTRPIHSNNRQKKKKRPQNVVEAKEREQHKQTQNSNK